MTTPQLKQQASPLGKLSVIFGAITLACLAWYILLSIRAFEINTASAAIQKTHPIDTGLIMFTAMAMLVCAILGLIFGIVKIIKPEGKKLAAIIGIIINGGVLLAAIFFVLFGAAIT